MNLIISIITDLISGIILFKIALFAFREFLKTEVGKWAYLILIWIIIVFLILEYDSIKKNKCAWITCKVINLISKP